jgi:hypothetical protein
MLGDDTALPGAIGFIQTAGELLNFHPHLHLLITDGVLQPDGTFERLPYPDARQLERLFRAELLRLLLDRGLITQEVIDNLLSWRHSGFSVHTDVCVTDRVCAARLGRYMIRCPVVLERLSLDTDTSEVLYRPRPSRADHPEGPVARWDVLELIARVLDHLPRPRQQMVRYWGYYSNVSRGKRAAARGRASLPRPLPAAEHLPEPEQEPFRRRARLTWAALIRRVYEIDPLLCPFCGAQMKIIAFILDRASIRRILQHLQMPAQRPEPLAHSPPLQEKLSWA